MALAALVFGAAALVSDANAAPPAKPQLSQLPPLPQKEPKEEGPEQPGASVVWSGDMTALGPVVSYAGDYCEAHYGKTYKPKLHPYDSAAKRLPFGCHIDRRPNPLGEPKPPYVPSHPYATEADYKAADADIDTHNDMTRRANARSAELCRRLAASDDPSKDPAVVAAYNRRIHADLAALRAKHPQFDNYFRDQEWNVTQGEQKIPPTWYRTQCTLAGGQ